MTLVLMETCARLKRRNLTKIALKEGVFRSDQSDKLHKLLNLMADLISLELSLSTCASVHQARRSFLQRRS